jgi:PAS domain-containing protein
MTPDTRNAADMIKDLLAAHRRGLTISDIANRLGMNRNLASRHLALLEARGEVESSSFGSARVYYAARRVPATALLSLSSDLVCTIDESEVLLFGNQTFLRFFGLGGPELRGRILAEIPLRVREYPLLSMLLSDIITGEETVRDLTFREESHGARPVHLKAKGIPTVFEDGSRGTTVIMEDRTVEREYTANLEFLARTSAQLADMRDDENIYEYIGDRIAELVPDSMVGVSAIHPFTGEVVVAALRGDRELLEGLATGLGIGSAGISFTMDKTPEAAPFLMRNHLEEGAEQLYVQLFRKYPEDLCDRIQEELSLGKNYGMGCVCRGGLYGSVTIRLRKGADLRNRETIEAFVRQAGVALQRRHIREKLRLAEDRIRELEA